MKLTANVPTHREKMEHKAMEILAILSSVEPQYRNLVLELAINANLNYAPDQPKQIGST